MKKLKSLGRVRFLCPGCGHRSHRIWLQSEGNGRDGLFWLDQWCRLFCEKCRAEVEISHPTISQFIYGLGVNIVLVILGGAISLIYVPYLLHISPLYVVFAVTAASIPLNWFFLPHFSAVIYRWKLKSDIDGHNP